MRVRLTGSVSTSVLKRTKTVLLSPVHVGTVLNSTDIEHAGVIVDAKRHAVITTTRHPASPRIRIAGVRPTSTEMSLASMPTVPAGRPSPVIA